MTENAATAQSDPPADLAAVFDAMPEPVQARMLELRRLILKAGKDVEAGPLTETLKWGQPAWLTEVSRSGTTLRMGWTPALGDRVALYVHCQTDLVDRYRAQFPDEFEFQGDRAVLIPVEGALPDVPLRRVIAQALTYHRDKRKGGVN